jgi:hypothetical protein
MVAGDAVLLALLLAGALALALLFRDRGWAPAGAVVAGLVFAFGASASWRIQHVGQIMSLAWFAITLFLLGRALMRGSLLWAALAGVGAGLMILGRDQVALIGAYVLAGFVVAAWLQAERRLEAFGRSLAPLAVTGIVAVLVAALPILLTLALAGESNRPAIDFDGAGKGSLHPASLLTLFVANLFGAAGPLENFWGQPSPAWNTRFGDVELFLARNMSVAYVGALPLLAILGIGIFGGRAWDRTIRATTILAVLVMLYALGRYTPAFGLMFEALPGVSFYRRPADALFILGALLALLSGYLVHLVANGEAAITRAMWLGAAAVSALALTSGLVLAGTVGRGPVAQVPTLIAASSLIIAAGALWLTSLFGRRSAIAAALVAASTLAVDLAVSNGPSESTGLPSAQYDVLNPATTNDTIARLRAELARTAAPDRRDRIELAGVDFHWPNASMTHGFDHTLGYNPLRLGDFSRATGAGDHVALPSQRTFSALMPGYRSLMADMLGLRFIVTRGPITDVDKALPPGILPVIARTSDGLIHENPGALPRVLVVPASRHADFGAILTSGQWPERFDPRREVLLEDAPPPEPCASPARPVTESAARIVDYGTTTVTISTRTPACAFLVLNDTWHRWWRVEVNGEQAELLRANVLFRAVAIPAGEAEVRFIFRPFEGLSLDLAARAPTLMARMLAAGSAFAGLFGR